MGMLPALAVQALWDIARCMFTVVHSNADIGMSGVVSCLCAVHGCTITGGYAGGKGDCVSNVCGCAGAMAVCWQCRVAITHCNTDIGMGCLCTICGCAIAGGCVGHVCGCASAMEVCDGTTGKLTCHNVISPWGWIYNNKPYQYNCQTDYPLK